MPVLALLALLVSLIVAAPASAAAPPANADYTEEYFASGDGTTLHADVFRPKGVTGPVPVILTVSPYTAHSGATTTEAGASGPSSRFYDFLEAGKVLERGYAYVMVDLRGFGGSGGCGDWGGPGEQMDAKAAVEWAATRAWSNGKVGMYGKSYDGWTGLMALAQRPTGLAAVVSQEPVYDGYRYLYMNRVPFGNRSSTPQGFVQYDLKPGAPTDTPQYQANGLIGTAMNPQCYLSQLRDTQDASEQTSYWKPRNLIPRLAGVKVPTLLTQGFLESNTKPDAAFTAWNNLSGTQNQAIFGQFDHVRINDKDADGKPAMGRTGLVDQAMRFFGEHLKDEKPSVKDPEIAVQDNRGDYREEKVWPPVDVFEKEFDLVGGTYTDTGAANGRGTNVKGLWTLSQPLPREAHLAGVPVVTVDADFAGEAANVVGDVYDVAPDNKATLVSRGAFLMPGAGKHSWELYGQDWRFAAGHRVAVLLTHANDDWFRSEKTDAVVTVKSASVTLPFLAGRRVTAIDGTGVTARLKTWLNGAFALPAAAAAPERGSELSVPQRRKARKVRTRRR